MLIHGFTYEEWQQFTKTERRILALVHEMKYERQQILLILEIDDATLRGHIANMRRKQSRFRAERAKQSTSDDMQRAKAVSLPEMEIPKEIGVAPHVDHNTQKKGAKFQYRRHAQSHLPITELMKPFADVPLAKPFPKEKVHASPFLKVKNISSQQN